MRRILLLAAFLAFSAHAVEREGSGSAVTSVTFAAGTPLTITSLVVPTGTEMLVAVVGTGSDMGSVTDDVDWHAGEKLSKVGETVASGNVADVWVSVWCLMNPTIDTANLYAEPASGSNNKAWLVAVMYSDVPDDTCANIWTLLDTDEDDAGASATSVFASAGTAGNTAFLACGANGEVSSPWSDNASFSSIVNSVTGGGQNNASDHAFYVADKIAGLATAVTATNSRDPTDEHSCIFMEIATAATGTYFWRHR